MLSCASTNMRGANALRGLPPTLELGQAILAKDNVQADPEGSFAACNGIFSYSALPSSCYLR